MSQRGSILIYLPHHGHYRVGDSFGTCNFCRVAETKTANMPRRASSRFSLLKPESIGIAGIWRIKLKEKLFSKKKIFGRADTAKGVGTPYQADVNDPEGGTLGKYKLEVTPPSADSTIVIVKSTGWTNKSPNVKRIIQVRFRQPAWCEYAVVADDFMRFGEERKFSE